MILHTDGNWVLEQPDKDLTVYVLAHKCRVDSEVVIYRFKDSRNSANPNKPCGWCGSKCPKNLQGLYNALVYL